MQVRGGPTQKNSGFDFKKEGLSTRLSAPWNSLKKEGYPLTTYRPTTRS